LIRREVAKLLYSLFDHSNCAVKIERGEFYMKFKSVFTGLAIIVVLTLTSIVPIPRVEAGPGQNGPYLDQLYFKEYFNMASEWVGMKVCDIDIMGSGLARFRMVSENGPTGLNVPQYIEWLQPWLQALIAIEEEIQLGMYEFDINTHDTMGLPGATYSKPLVPSPTSDPAFRAAVAKLVDKAIIATQDFSGLLEIMDVPLVPPKHNAYINPAVVGSSYAFKYDGAQAQLDLDLAGYTQVVGMDNPYVGGPSGWLENVYPWAVPLMRRNALTGNLIGTDYNWGGGNEGLVIYARSDIPELTAAGMRLRDVLRASGIPVVFVPAPKLVCFDQVKAFFGYHFYTGSWELDWVPDHLHDFYTSEYANPYDFNYMLFNGLGPDHPNGPLTKSVALETLLDFVKNAQTQWAMILAAQNVQAALWGPISGWLPVVGGMPSIILGHINPLRTAYKNGWMNIVNMQSVGVGNWWSYFLGYYPPNPTVNTIRVGLPSPIQNLNTVTAEWTHDLAVLENIYDPLIGFDPYNIQTSFPTGLANNWVVSTWGPGNTQVKFTLRSGLKWHPNQQIYFAPSNGGNGATVPASSPTGNPLTVDDVAYSWLYHQAQYGWFYSSVYQILEVQTKNGPPTLPPPVGAFPYPALTTPGGLTAIWTANAALGNDDIVAKMSLQSWLALRWLGEVPIIPMFIWSNVLNAYAFNPVSANAVVGSGPWKFNTWSPGTFLVLDANRDYFLSIGSGTADEFIKECFHRRGDAGSMTGSGPSAYDGKVDAWDLIYFIGGFSPGGYSSYPMPNYWRDDLYTSITYSGVSGISFQTGIAPPFDGTGQESTNNVNWGPVIAYPWRVQNTGAGPPWFYVDFNYDHKVDVFDFAILGMYWGTDAGSGW